MTLLKGISTQSLIGSPEGVKNAIFTLREKQAQKLLSGFSMSLYI